MTVAGTVRSGFEAVRDSFAEAQTGDKGDAQLAVYQRGQLVVDLWTNNDPTHTGDSISILMSTTKGVAATCAHLLSQQGLLDVDAPVAQYWPEFAANGKQDITVRHVLTHSAGLFGFPVEAGIGAEELMDWDRCVTVLARMAPFWEPGTAFAYHAVTFGYLLGEVIRRITGRTAGQFFASEVAKPLSLDLWIGLPESEEHRVAEQFSSLLAPSPEQVREMVQELGLDTTDPMVRTMLVSFGVPDVFIRLLNTRAGHAAEIPAGNGIGNARSLAKMYAALIGEVDGVRLFEAETLDRARLVQTHRLSVPKPIAAIPQDFPLRFTLGYEAARPGLPMLGDSGFGHAGAGGRLAFGDPDTGAAVGYTCTNMAWDAARGPDARWSPWMAALREAVAH
jgi:CubicO group peptidase (beta-lactamase class C family)